ncbi:MAG: cobalt transporter CbiM [Chloroflexota bacterium]|nr:cobalt transporter CbiM [Chloroflexota bacterium]
MHIADGVLPTTVCAAGYGATALLTCYSLRRIKQEGDPKESIPKASLLTAAFFVVSWIHIPIPPTSVHLVLNGLLGVVLGYFAFPAILIGLFFQAVMFQHGGLTTLGVNSIIIGLPALLAYQIFRLRHVLGVPNRMKTGFFGFLASVCATGLSVGIFALILINFIPADLVIETERKAIFSLAVAHMPLMFIEGAFTVLVTTFLYKVKPELLATS